MGNFGAIIELQDEPAWCMDEEDFYDMLNELGAQYVQNVEDNEDVGEYIDQLKKTGKDYFDFGQDDDWHEWMSIKEGAKNSLTIKKCAYIREAAAKFFELSAEDQGKRMDDFHEDIGTYLKSDIIFYSGGLAWTIEKFIFNHKEGYKFYIGNVVEYKY